MSIERFEEVKKLLKGQIEQDNAILIEGSNLMSFLNVLSYHYCLIEGQVSNAYNNQYIDSVNNEADLISICQMVGYVRRSKVPNSIYLQQISTARNDSCTSVRQSVNYTFRALNSGAHEYYEGTFNTWNLSPTTDNNQRCRLTNSQNLYVSPKSLVVTLNSVILKPCEELKHYGDIEYYYILENSDGTYSVQVFSNGSLSVSGLLVGSKESHSIKEVTKGGVKVTSPSVSTGYLEKETMSDVVKKFPSILTNNNRSITIGDYNVLGDKLFPDKNLFFYEENLEGVVYFSNRAESSLTSAEYNQIIDTFKNHYMIPGIELRYKRLIPKIWVINLECLVTNSSYESFIRTSVDTYFNNITNELSLFKLMQTMYDQHSPYLVDIKVNVSYIKIPIRGERVVDLGDKRGVVSVRPYMKYDIKDNKIYFIAPYNGEIKISNVLSPITFKEGDYIDYQYAIDFTYAR